MIRRHRGEVFEMSDADNFVNYRPVGVGHCHSLEFASVFAVVESCSSHRYGEYRSVQTQ